MDTVLLYGVGGAILGYTIDKMLDKILYSYYSKKLSN